MAPQMQGDMSEAKERYILSNDWEEINRMFHQHEWVKASAGGLVKAPIDLYKGGLRVLDAATADGKMSIQSTRTSSLLNLLRLISVLGLWLNDARSIFPEDAELVGFDIA